MRGVSTVCELGRIEAKRRSSCSGSGTGGPGQADRRLVDGEARVRIDDLVARPAGREHGEEQERLRAVRDENALRVDATARERATDTGCRLAQLRQPRRRAVVRLPVPERATPASTTWAASRSRVRRSQMDDLAPLGLESLSAREQLERALGPEAIEAPGEGKGRHETAAASRGRPIDDPVTSSSLCRVRMSKCPVARIVSDTRRLVPRLGSRRRQRAPGAARPHTATGRAADRRGFPLEDTTLRPIEREGYLRDSARAEPGRLVVGGPGEGVAPGLLLLGEGDVLLVRLATAAGGRGHPDAPASDQQAHALNIDTVAVGHATRWSRRA